MRTRVKCYLLLLLLLLLLFLLLLLLLLLLMMMMVMIIIIINLKPLSLNEGMNKNVFMAHKNFHTKDCMFTATDSHSWHIYAKTTT